MTIGRSPTHLKSKRVDRVHVAPVTCVPIEASSHSDADVQSWSQCFWLIAIVLVLIVQVVVEYMMGRPVICTCGYVKLFAPDIKSGGNSQHIADWYTPTHVIHGFLLYFLMHLIVACRKPSSHAGMRLFIAALIEVAWEIAENSPPVIARFRDTHGYAGDSILNSFMDVIFMTVGFLFAWGAPAWVTVAIALTFELITVLVIRDNFVLQVLMLIYPVEAIKRWQDAL